MNRRNGIMRGRESIKIGDGKNIVLSRTHLLANHMRYGIA